MTLRLMIWTLGFLVQLASCMAIAKVDLNLALPASDADMSMLSAIKSGDAERIRSLIAGGQQVGFDYENVCFSVHRLITVTPGMVIRTVMQPTGLKDAWQGRLDDPDLLTLRPFTQLKKDANVQIGGWVFPTRCAGLYMAYAADLASQDTNIVFSALSPWEQSLNPSLHQRAVAAYSKWKAVFEALDAATPDEDKYAYPFYAMAVANMGRAHEMYPEDRPAHLLLSLWFLQRYVEALPVIEKMRNSQTPHQMQFRKILEKQADKWGMLTQRSAFYDTRPIRSISDDPLALIFLWIQPKIIHRFVSWLEDRPCKDTLTTSLLASESLIGQRIELTPQSLEAGMPEIPLPAMNKEQLKNMYYQNSLHRTIPAIASFNANAAYYRFLRSRPEVGKILYTAAEPSKAEQAKYFGFSMTHNPHHRLPREKWTGRSELMRLVMDRKYQTVAEKKALALMVREWRNLGIDLERGVDEQTGMSVRSALMRMNSPDITEAVANPQYAGPRIEVCR